MIKSNDESDINTLLSTIPKWIPVDVVMGVINDDWSWVRNSRCKYIELRIDTRNRCCVLKDRHGNRITLEQLKHQIR